MNGIKTIDSKFYKLVGNCIRQKRKDKGYTLDYMAKMIGVSKQAYDYIELGLVKIKPKIWDKICEILEVYSDIDIKVKIGL